MSNSKSYPLGATVVEGGVNFSLYSRIATGVELVLFDKQDDPKPTRVIRIPATEHTYHYWHTFVPKLKAGQLYGYRVEGPDDAAHGRRFDAQKILLDPYGKVSSFRKIMIVLPQGSRVTTVRPR